MDFRITRLGAGDTRQMAALNGVFYTAFDNDPAYGPATPQADYITVALSNPTVIALVALSEETVIGGLVAYVLPKLEQARSEIYIYDLAVAEAARRRGVATALITEIRHIAADIGAWVVYVQADRGDTAPETLYTKLGQREDVLHFDMTPLGR